jgi:beta-lactamase class A
VRHTPSGNVTPSPPYTPLVMFVDGELDDRIRKFLGDDINDYGIVIKRFSDGRGTSINPHQVFYAASLFKVEVLFEVYKQRAAGRLDFADKLEVTPKLAEYDLQTLPWKIGDNVAIKDLVEAMITFSDNTSAMMLYQRVAGRNIDLDMHAIGLQDSDILSEDITTTAYDMALLLEMMARGQAVDRKSSEEMIALLARQRINNRIPALLPRGLQIAHKTGEWENATHDVGVVYAPKGTYVIALMSSKPWNINALAKLSGIVYEYLQAL